MFSLFNDLAGIRLTLVALLTFTKPKQPTVCPKKISSGFWWFLSTELNTPSVTQSPPSVHQSLLSHKNDFAKVCLLIKPKCLLLWKGSGGREEEREERKEEKEESRWLRIIPQRKKKKQLIFAPSCLFLQTFLSFSCLFCYFPKYYRNLSSQPLPTSERVQFLQVLCEYVGFPSSFPQ